MARNRFIVDLVTEEPLTRRQHGLLAQALNDWLQAVGSDGIEGRDGNTTNFHGHVHVSTPDRACDICVYAARDGLS